jgi:hypothetical protein
MVNEVQLRVQIPCSILTPESEHVKVLIPCNTNKIVCLFKLRWELKMYREAGIAQSV